MGSSQSLQKAICRKSFSLAVASFQTNAPQKKKKKTGDETGDVGEKKTFNELEEERRFIWH